MVGDDEGSWVARGGRRLAGRLLDLCREAIEEIEERVDRDADDDDPPAPVTAPPTRGPLAPGATAPPVLVPAAGLEQLLRAALGLTYAASGHPDPTAVIWQDGDGEVLAHLAATRVVVHDGLVLVGVTLETDETGRGELVVPFAVGSPQSPAGLLAATETRPRGPQALVDRWGDAVIAAAWLALIDVAHGLALHAGTDLDGAGLIPGALATDGTSLIVVPQARLEGDRISLGRASG